MTNHFKTLSPQVVDLVKSHGFDEFAVIAPSASGGPLRTSLAPAAFQAHSIELFDDAEDMLAEDLGETAF